MANSIEAIVFAALKALVTNTDGTARCYPDVGPANAVRPYITYQQVGGQSPNITQNVIGIQNTRLQVNVWADTLATCWLVTRTDGQAFGFTDHDTDIIYNGTTYTAVGGFSASALEVNSDFSTSNMEMSALFDTGAVKEPDVIAGMWNNAAVSVFLVNYADLTMGQVTLAAGRTGQFKPMNGRYVVEFRSLAQIMQQEIGQVYSPTCRANLGDSRCKVALGPLTYNGTVTGVPNTMSINDTGLTQTGTTSSFKDTSGTRVPTQAPYTITAVPPTGGTWQSDGGVTDGSGRVLTAVASNPGEGQYSVSNGVYTFSSTDPGLIVYISYNYGIAYFAYGSITFTSGQNKGYKTDVKTSSVGALGFTLPLPYPVAVGDTYTVVAGCDRQFGTCKSRFNNVVNFRGEHLIPGTDAAVRMQNS